MSSKKSLDTGTATTPTPRLDVSAPGMPGTTPAADAGVATATATHADVTSPGPGVSYPPSAPSDLGDQTA